MKQILKKVGVVVCVFLTYVQSSVAAICYNTTDNPPIPPQTDCSCNDDSDTCGSGQYVFSFGAWTTCDGYDEIFVSGVKGCNTPEKFVPATRGKCQSADSYWGSKVCYAAIVVLGAGGTGTAATCPEAETPPTFIACVGSVIALLGGIVGTLATCSYCPMHSCSSPTGLALTPDKAVDKNTANKNSGKCPTSA